MAKTAEGDSRITSAISISQPCAIQRCQIIETESIRNKNLKTIWWWSLIKFKWCNCQSSLSPWLTQLSYVSWQAVIEVVVDKCNHIRFWRSQRWSLQVDYQTSPTKWALHWNTPAAFKNRCSRRLIYVSPFTTHLAEFSRYRYQKYGGYG